MSTHAQELLLLRDGSTDGELLFRKQIMRLLGAVPEPGLTGVSMVRRAEGAVSISDGVDGVVYGLVVFAVGDDGRGALADVRSKSGQVSARSLLVARGVDFVIVVTTGEPSPAMREAAEAKSELFWLGGVLHRKIWVMGVPEVVERGERFLTERGLVQSKRGLWARITGKAKGDFPTSPLLVRVREPAIEALEELEESPAE